MDNTSAMDTGARDGIGASAADQGSMPLLALTSAHDVLEHMNRPASPATAGAATADATAAVRAQKLTASVNAMQAAVDERTPKRGKHNHGNAGTPSSSGGKGATGSKVIGCISDFTAQLAEATKTDDAALPLNHRAFWLSVGRWVLVISSLGVGHWVC